VKAKPPAKLENINDEPNVAQSPLPRSGSVQQDAAGNSRPASQLTVYENFNIIIAGHARFRRLCLS
jgi:hypothetical protein